MIPIATPESNSPCAAPAAKPHVVVFEDCLDDVELRTDNLSAGGRKEGDAPPLSSDVDGSPHPDPPQVCEEPAIPASKAVPSLKQSNLRAKSATVRHN